MVIGDALWLRDSMSASHSGINPCPVNALCYMDVHHKRVMTITAVDIGCIGS